jgi:putative oxidoreductase
MNIVAKVNNCTWVTEDRAKLILRVTLGVLTFLHGWFKLTNPEAMGFVSSLFTGLGLPAFLAYFVLLGEIVAPIMLIIGYETRIASLLVIATLVVAILLVHTGDLFALNAMTGGYALELQAFYLLGAVAIFGLGAGKHVLIRK